VGEKLELPEDIDEDTKKLLRKTLKNLLVGKLKPLVEMKLQNYFYLP
jgi:hypothetical protein